MWLYRSPIGNIHIKLLSNGQYGTIFNGIVYEACDDPWASADNVLNQATGSEWDVYDIADIEVPNDLSEWEKV